MALQVNNSYVLKKLSLILYPFANKSWARLPADEFERGEVSEQVPLPPPHPTPSSSIPSYPRRCPRLTSSPVQGEQITHKWALPRNDLNAPDLYIPLMAFITYILLCGFDAGLRSASSRSFSPEIIIQATWRCVALLAVEGCAAKVGLNLLSVSVPFLDVFSYAGYKFVPLCLNILARMLHPTLNVLLSLASSGMVAYFVLKTVASVVPPSAAGAQGTQRYMVLFGFAAAQLALVLVMSML